MGGLRRVPAWVVINHEGARSLSRAQKATTCSLLGLCESQRLGRNVLSSYHSVMSPLPGGGGSAEESLAGEPSEGVAV